MKKAIQRLIRGDDGKLKIVFIDAVTLKQLPNSQGYQVINSNADQYWEPVQSVDKPNVPSATTSIQDLNPEINSHGTDRQSELGITTSSKPPESLARQSVRESLKPSSSSTRVSPESSVRALAVNPDISPSVSTASRVNPESVQERQVSETNPEIAKSIPGEVNPLGIGNTPTGLARLDYSGLAGKHRNQPPDADFMKDIQESVTGFFGPGYTVHLEAGKGRLPGKSGNANHPFGKALDFTVSDPTGKKVSQSRMEDYGAYAVTDMGKKFTGVGIGPGYMSPGEMHLDKVHRNPTAWGDYNTGATMTPGVESAIEQAGQTGAPVYGMGLPEYMGTTPTPRSSIAKDVISDAVKSSVSNDYADVQENPLGKFTGVTGSAPGYTGIVGADAKEYGITGEAAVRNNNPGNITSNNWDNSVGDNKPNKKYSYGVYATPEDGAKAKASLLGGKVYGPLSITDAITKYAPPDDNPTQAYIDKITKDLGLPSSTKISDLNKNQFDTMLSSISSFESPGKAANVTDSLGRHIGTYSNGQLTRDTSAPGFYTARGSLMDTPSETSGIGRGSRVGGSYTGRSGVDSPSESGSRFGGSGLGQGYSGKGGLDSPSESVRSSGGFKGSSKGSGFASGGSDKEKDRSLDRDSGKKDHSKGGYNAD